MKTHSHARMVDADPSWMALTTFPEATMLSVLGHDLRHLYDDVTDGNQPDDLMRLALMVDARRLTAASEA